MKKKIIIGAVVGCASLAAVAAAKNRTASSEPSPTIWEKMSKGMEDMPEDFPPRVMWENIQATRANSDRIVELLERQAARTTSSSDDIEVVPTT